MSYEQVGFSTSRQIWFYIYCTRMTSFPMSHEEKIVTVHPIIPSVHKMVKHTLKILKQMLQDF